jgi:hypothetical protein
MDEPWAFPVRGLEKVHAAFSLTAFPYNLRRGLSIVEFQKLMTVLSAERRLQAEFCWNWLA